MIDYDKFKLAHELAEKAIELGCKSIVIEYNSYHGLAANSGHSLYLGGDGEDLEECDIDSIINQLRELTKPEPKYKVGDTVYFLGDDHNPIRYFTIDEIINDSAKYWYLHYIDVGNYSDGERDFNQYREDCLYPSREALIDAQIEYWKSLKGDQLVLGEKADGFVSIPVADCVHESDGMVYTSNPPQYRCKKCREFYRC